MPNVAIFSRNTQTNYSRLPLSIDQFFSKIRKTNFFPRQTENFAIFYCDQLLNFALFFVTDCRILQIHLTKYWQISRSFPHVQQKKITFISCNRLIKFENFPGDLLTIFYLFFLGQSMNFTFFWRKNHWAYKVVKKKGCCDLPNWPEAIFFSYSSICNFENWCLY